MEVPLMFFITLAMLSLIFANKKHRSFYVLFGLSVGLAILSKGVVGFLPLFICFLAIIMQNKFSDFGNPFFLIGLLLSLFIPGIWFYLKGGMSLNGAWKALIDYISFVLGAFKGLGRIDPGSRFRFITRLFEFCFIITPGVFLGMYFVIRDSIKEKRRDLLTIPIWAILFLVAFSISKWRRGLFLLPMYPAMALLFGIGLYKILHENYRMFAVYLIIAFFAGDIIAPFLFPHWEPKSIQEVIYRNTNLPKIRKAVKALYAQAGQHMRFVAYQQRDKCEFVFFFSSDYKIEFCESQDEFRKLVNLNSPILFYIPQKKFSKINKRLHNKLKIVYAFDDQLLVTNRMDLVPVFD